MLKRSASLALALAAGAAALSSAALAQDKVQLSIGTGGTGGVYYPLAGGIGNILSKHIPGMALTAEVTGGSVDNLKLIGKGPNAYLGMTMADVAQDANKGEDKFKGNTVPVRTLFVMYPNRQHIVTIEGTGISKIGDLKGKRVSTGSPGSATEVMAFRTIEAAGLDKDKDMRRERLGVAESVNAVKDKKIDAFFWVGGLPTAAVTDLANTPGVKVKVIDYGDVLPNMNKKHPGLYYLDTIPKEVYKGMDADAKIASVANLFVAHEQLSEKVAYDIVKGVFDKIGDIAAVHAEGKNIKLEAQKLAASPIPWHPGALKFYKEKGVKMD